MIDAREFLNQDKVKQTRKRKLDQTENDVSIERLDAFVVLHSNVRQARMKTMITNIKRHRDNCKPYNPTSWMKKGPDVSGMQIVDLENANVLHSVRA